MEDEMMDLEEASGDTAEMQIATVAGGETESILVVLTSLFLLIAVSLISLKLYNQFGLFKDSATVKSEEKKLQSLYIK